uniref:Helitron_like_N domain-containing protein n=1 Tax=Strongyloides venezuelensis TaxID=75913 RepID=A0A0K0FBC4_STRVS
MHEGNYLKHSAFKNMSVFMKRNDTAYAITYHAENSVLSNMYDIPLKNGSYKSRDIKRYFVMRYLEQFLATGNKLMKEMRGAYKDLPNSAPKFTRDFNMFLRMTLMKSGSDKLAGDELKDAINKLILIFQEYTCMSLREIKTDNVEKNIARRMNNFRNLSILDDLLTTAKISEKRKR